MKQTAKVASAAMLCVLPWALVFLGRRPEWTELLREVLIVAGLGLVPVWRGLARGIPLTTQGAWHAALLLALVYSYLIAQYNIGSQTSNGDLLSVSVLGIAIASAVLTKLGGARDEPQSRTVTWDLTVAALGAVILAMILARHVIGNGGTVETTVRATGAVVTFLLIYYAVTRTAANTACWKGWRVGQIMVLSAWAGLVIADVGSLLHLANVHSEKKEAQTLLSDGNLGAAAEAYLAAAGAASQFGITLGSPDDYLRLASVLHHQGRAEEALRLQSRGVDLLERVEAPSGQRAAAYMQTGEILFSLGSDEQANRMFGKSASVGGKFSQTLAAVQRKYPGPSGQKLWRGLPFVQYNGFESGVELPVHWAGNMEPSNQVVGRSSTAYKGAAAVRIEADYGRPTGGPYHYWRMGSDIGVDGPMGIRLYARNDEGWKSRVSIVVGVDYGTTHGVVRSAPQVVGSEWTCLSTPDIEEVTKHGGLFDSEARTPRRVVMVGIDTHGESCRLSLDEIEVFLPILKR